MYILDASVAAERLLRTPLGESLEPLLGEATLVAPHLLDAEVLAVLRKLCQRGALRADRATEALADLRDWDVERLAHGDLFDEAWALRGRVSAYDALYVAAARLCEGTLLTADGRLSRAPALGVPVHHARLT